MKVVINRSYGGFGLSEEAIKYLNETYNLPYHSFFSGLFYYLDDDLPRNDPRLIECVEKLGERANGVCAKLKIVEVPDDVEWEISDYDGAEMIEEVHRSWC